MIFKQRSNLAFAGLHKIQELLENQLTGMVPEDTLLVLASLPSLDSRQKTDLEQVIDKFSKIIFWCYGDLVWNLPLWQSLENKLQGKQLQWIVASNRWKNLASVFIPSQHLVLHPHPLHLASNLPSKRDERRSKLGIKNHEKLLFYAGRRSSQKNLPWLIKLWRDANEASNIPIKLAVAGPWCDYGRPQFPEADHSMKKIQGTWTQLLQMYPEDLFDLGELSFSDVTAYIQAADCVVTLSTFLEEDFGLFTREARCLGVPVVATNWGGLADMQDSGTHLVDLKYENSVLNLDFKHALIQLKKALETKSAPMNYMNAKPDLAFRKELRFTGFYPAKVQDLDLKTWQALMLGLEHGS